MKSVKGEVVNTIEIEKSKFITYLKRVNSTTEADNYLAQIKKKHYDATHNCVAFIIGENGETQRSSDNGEPSGTAGVPMLEVLKKNNITNTICIVTRYFGGIKLGAGGLIRAYSNSVSEALRKAKFTESKLVKRYEIIIDYPTYNILQNYLKPMTISSEFYHNISITVLTDDLNFEKKITDSSFGKAYIKFINEEYKDVDVE